MQAATSLEQLRQFRSQRQAALLEICSKDHRIHGYLHGLALKEFIAEFDAYLCSVIDPENLIEEVALPPLPEARVPQVQLPEFLLALMLLGDHFREAFAPIITASERPAREQQSRRLETGLANLRISSIANCKKHLQPHSGTEQETAFPSRLNLFFKAFQYSTDAIIITDIRGRIVEANRAFLSMFGYRYEEVIGKTTSILRSEQTSDAFYERLWQTINEKGEWKGEIINRTKAGEEIPVWLSITPIFEGKTCVGYMGIEFDLRRHKEMERKILQSGRLAIIGQMAAKVAHEIRNPLSSISLNVELLEDEIRAVAPTLPHEAESLLAAIMAEVERVTLLTQEYLQFSRLPEAEFQRTDMNKLVSAIAEFVEPEANSIGIQVVFEGDSRLAPASVDKDQIRRVLLNLCRNGIEAMRSGGVLRITTTARGDDVLIEVSDTGEGIPESGREKIFEPFYTTKDMGTGLGLAISAQIIQEHGGNIAFESRAGRGTTFSICLPLDHRIDSDSGEENP